MSITGESMKKSTELRREAAKQQARRKQGLRSKSNDLCLHKGARFLISDLTEIRSRSSKEGEATQIFVFNQ
ncbi:hypothetical protein EUTSA_v10000730mg [Eutrema salsugineum]|uniref:Uncharacterized protein n=1 Tax=Eutrema salsugineum TaxID=72664 RepID=V4M1Y1_EUTSA|nr:hypothetical protein EUTSA_v10000730mg [Eutrema salsugineum]